MTRANVADRNREQGFTLIEAMVAMVILLFGVAAVSNLIVIAGSSNTVANHTTATVAAATRQMELLESTPWLTLVPGGSVTTDTGAVSVCGVSPIPAGSFQCNTSVTAPNAEFQGVGRVHVRWAITPVTGVLTTYHIEVAAESMAPAIGARSRADFTSIRASN